MGDNQLDRAAFISELYSELSKEITEYSNDYSKTVEEKMFFRYLAKQARQMNERFDQSVIFKYQKEKVSA